MSTELDDLEVREADNNDVNALSQLWWELAKEMEDKSIVNQLTDKEDAIAEVTEFYEQYDYDPNYRAYIAVDDDYPVGYIDLQLRRSGILQLDTSILIRQLYVREPYRNQGIGSVLLDKSAEVAESEDIDFLEVPVEWDNTDARRLYESKGFEKKSLRLVKVTESL